MSTNLQRIEELGRQLEDHYTTLKMAIECLPWGVVFCDRDFKVKLWNQAARRIIGAPPADNVGVHVWSTLYRATDESGGPLDMGQLPLIRSVNNGETVHSWRCIVNGHTVEIGSAPTSNGGAVALFKIACSDCPLAKERMDDG